MSRPSCAPKTREEHERIGRLHVPANLRGRLIGTIERADIARLHHEMSDRPHQANRTIALLSKAFAWAEKHGLRPNGVNPSRFIDKYSEAKRERFLSPQELARLGSYWTNGRTRTQSPRSACYCSQEPGAPSPYRQMGRGRLERGTVRLAETKTGPKTIYLNAPALEVLNNLVRISENPFAICGEKSDSHLVNLQKPWRTVREAAGFDDVRLHHLRHTFASVGVGGGASLPMVGALLGHSQPQTTDRYAHLAADPLRAASDAIARRIAASLNDAPRKPAAPNRTPL